VFSPTYVALNDPQWLAHALMTTALVVLWRPLRADSVEVGAGHTGLSGAIPAGAMIAAIVLMLGAGLIKHLLIPLPIVTTIWLARRSRVDLRTWLVGCLGLLAIVGALLTWLYGASFFHSLVAARKYSLAYLLPKLEYALLFFLPMLALAAAGFSKWRARERDVFITLYAVIAFSLAILVSAGAGLDVNAFFDAMIAVSLLLAVAVEKLSRSTPPAVESTTLWGSIALIAAGLYLLTRMAIAMPAAMEARRGLPAREREVLTDLHSIARWGRGAAACENPALCYWAGQPLTVDFFNFAQKMKTGKLPAESCVQLFSSGEIPLLQLASTSHRVGTALFPSKCNAALQAHYDVLSTSGSGMLLKFRSAGAG